MLKSETQDIEGLSVTVSQLPGRASLRANFRLMKMVMAGGFGGTGSIEQMLSSAIAGADVEDLMSLSMELLSTARVVFDGKIYEMSEEKNIDAVFSGKSMALIQAVMFAVKVNWGDFFSKTPDATGGVAGQAKASP